MSYLLDLFKNEPTQLEPIIGSNQVKNNASGYAYPVTDWSRLSRFLVLGSEGGTYYQKESQITLENASCVVRCVEEDGRRTIDEIMRVSQSGVAPKNDACLFALAIATKATRTDVRKYAYAALPFVARTGTHILHFCAFCQSMRGWSRGLRTAVSDWFLDKDPRDLAYQAVKYQGRDGWTLRDLLRLAHPVPAEGSSTKDVINWIAHGWENIGTEPHPDANMLPIWGFEAAKRATDVREIVTLIRDYRLVREAIPTQFLTDVNVWEALLQEMPMEAMLRNLATMTKIGLLTHFSDAGRLVCSRLADVERIRKSRLHPIKILAAQLTYAQGHGMRSDSTWAPVAGITDVLSDITFYAAFQNVEPTRKRICLALDVSGSMTSPINGMPYLSCRDATAALSLVTAKTEAGQGGGTYICGFSTSFIPLNITPSQRLDDAIRAIQGLPFAGTDCALPMVEFSRTKQPVDAFVIYTDSETWAGKIHPSRALEEYRQALGIDAKLIVVGMTSSGFTIADPNDAGSLDIAGFGTDTPAVISSFIRGDV